MSNALETLEFVATKFGDTDWKYSDGRDGLKHIRYERDYTGYNHWAKRLGRALRPSRFRIRRRRSDSTLFEYVRDGVYYVVARTRVTLRKERNLPDCTVNGNIIHWSEDGTYIALMRPPVGEAVLEFLKNEPDHPNAVKIREEIERSYADSFGREENNEN